VKTRGTILKRGSECRRKRGVLCARAPGILLSPTLQKRRPRRVTRQVKEAKPDRRAHLVSASKYEAMIENGGRESEGHSAYGLSDIDSEGQVRRERRNESGKISKVSGFVVREHGKKRSGGRAREVCGHGSGLSGGRDRQAQRSTWNIMTDGVQYTGVFCSHGGDGLVRKHATKVVGNRIGGLRCSGSENQPRGVESKFRRNDSAGLLEESVRTLTSAMEAGGVAMEGSQRSVEAA
jgi:hypothetical protein